MMAITHQLSKTADGNAMSYVRSYPAVAKAASLARRELTAELGRCGMGPDVVECAALVLAELFANAVGHHTVRNGEQVGVVLRQVAGPCGAWLRIEVVDGGRGSVRGRLADTGRLATGGRGLRIVRGLGTRISDEVLPSGYLVVVSFPLGADVRARVCRCHCAACRHDGGLCEAVVDPAFQIPEAVAEKCAGPVCRPCLVQAGAVGAGWDTRNVFAATEEARCR